LAKRRQASFLSVPILARFGYHMRRIRAQIGGRFFRPLMIGVTVLILISAAVITFAEKDGSFATFGRSVYWSLLTVLGQGDLSYTEGPAGWAVHWFLAIIGVGLLATVTGAVVGFVIDFLLKEGQGMGAAGYEGHIVVCGWNSTARDLIDEMRLDEYNARIVLIHDTDKNPAGEGVYFIRGDATNEEDLKRAGIPAAAAAIVCPATPTDDADMRSILIVLAIETMAPQVRTVVEVNNPRHVPHFRRANVDEVLVTPILASHLLARTAMYPGLSGLVTDMVSGGPAGSELYRVVLPDGYVAGSVDDLSTRMRGNHEATLLAVARDASVFLNPRSDFRLQEGDHAIVVAKSLKALAPLKFADLVHEVAAVIPSYPSEAGVVVTEKAGDDRASDAAAVGEAGAAMPGDESGAADFGVDDPSDLVGVTTPPIAAAVPMDDREPASGGPARGPVADPGPGRDPWYQP
jgi:voltage-gated potassium channel